MLWGGPPTPIHGLSTARVSGRLYCGKSAKIVNNWIDWLSKQQAEQTTSLLVIAPLAISSPLLITIHPCFVNQDFFTHDLYLTSFQCCTPVSRMNGIQEPSGAMTTSFAAPPFEVNDPWSTMTATSVTTTTTTTTTLTSSDPMDIGTILCKLLTQQNRRQTFMHPGAFH